MKLQFFSGGFLARLKSSVTVNLEHYGAGAEWVDRFATGKAYLYESNQVVDPPPSLLVAAEDNSTLDGENARRVFTWLAGLSPAIAMEERLWSYLSHCVFDDYMRARWPATTESVVSRRYFFEGKSFAALSRHGISRLWWAGYLTKDLTRQDPFELTSTLFMRQDIQVSLLERSLGKCRNVRIAVLDYLRLNADWLSEATFGRRIQLLLKEINLLGGVAILDALPPDAIKSYLERVGTKLAAGTASSEPSEST